MPTIIPIRFAYASRDLWFDPVETGAVEGDHVICSTERGTEIGLVTGEAREVSDKEFSSMTDGASLKQLMRVASDEDLVRAEELARKGDEAMPVFRRCISGCGLDMKPVGVEYLFDGGKVVCYFAAEDRVDFRQLVRELSHELHARVDMRQIGVREESAHIGGYGHCGQELCCARFGPVFEPVSIRMAKEQDLPLNSAKISGACGRLMCCLRYEFEAYRDFKSRAPKRNAVIETPLGMGKIIEYDTPKEQIALRLENGKVIRVALADMTASETAVRKSEELGCACRPDTVAREVLERLNSPDVQMALAELDRKMGVLEEEPFDSSDIFIEPKPRRRARSVGYTVTESDGEAATSGKDAAQPASRRRRKKAATAEAADRGPEKGANDLAATGRRRRRHKSPEGISEASAAPGRTAGEPPAAAAPAAKRSRKPGDKGGSPRRAAAPAPEAGGSDDAPPAKKQPRRRGGRGRGGKGDQGSSGEQASE